MQNLEYELLPSDLNGQRLCQLFGCYRWNAIEADAPKGIQAKPKWRTIKDYAIRPRVLWERWQDPNQLIGVRFTHTTSYALLDIDAGSKYCSPSAIANIRAALETIGIVRSLQIRSSHSNGIHLYLPLPEPINTFNLAVALDGCLKAHDFRVKDGQLEIFPNVKAYGVTTFIDYKAHRLPLQPGSGSYLLDDDLNPISNGQSLSLFLQSWDMAAAGQDLQMLESALVAGRVNRRKRSKTPLSTPKVEAWQRDLEIEIAEGWTGYGQTNRLLKTIACYGLVFESLSQDALIDYIVDVATNCPGYTQYCRHQHHLRQRATSWAKSVENYYWPLGSRPLRATAAEPKGPSVNDVRSQDAQHRIHSAVQHLVKLGQLPATARLRMRALVQSARTSCQTLYKHLSLWHPEHYSPEHYSEAVETCSEPNSSQDVELDEASKTQCVTPDYSRHSSFLAPQSRETSESVKTLKHKVLHTSGGTMKCWSPSAWQSYVLPLYDYVFNLLCLDARSQGLSQTSLE